MKLIDSGCWWSGPAFFFKNSVSVFKDHSSVNTNECSERRKTALEVSKEESIIGECPLITRFLSYNRLIRVLAWMLRFITKIRPKALRKPSPTTLHLLASEVRNTEFLCVRFTQELHFSREYSDKTHRRAS